MLPVPAIKSALGSISARRVAILGITFKPFTDDTREAPALDLLSMLTSQGAIVAVHDPEGGLPADAAATQYQDVYAALAGAEAVVVAVEWPEYLDLDWARVAAAMAPGALVFDGRNCLERSVVEAAGLMYTGVGRAG
jgi:UDPglucose 6-dehydrogenase